MFSARSLARQQGEEGQDLATKARHLLWEETDGGEGMGAHREE